MRPVAPKTIADYADEFLRLGEERFAAFHVDPTLIRRDETEDDSDAEFHTGVMDLGALQALMRAQSTARPSRFDSKFVSVRSQVFVVKKGEGAFRDQIGIGRARNADVSIPLPLISKYHASIIRQPDGRLMVSDAGSKNGTFVGGRQLETGESVPLEDKTELKLGPYRFLFTTAESFREMVSFWADFRK